ncbi:MAG: helix-turn-helix transcriptional regulator [Candidatus Eisenbacteria bacterium]|nr:helix-turn-helix transcriptional regulator [Candidatus Eisenbacteria bacterium]
MPSKQEVGRRLRLARFRHNMTLKDVAVKSGMSATHISEIERGSTSPTIGCLQKIAAALGERPAYFVEESEPTRVKLTRRDARPKEYRCGTDGHVVVGETVTGGAPWSTMHVAYGFINVGETINRPPGMGEVVVLCMSGMIRATIEDQSVVIREGDTVQFKFDRGYRLENVGDERAEGMVIAAYPERSGW